MYHNILLTSTKTQLNSIGKIATATANFNNIVKSGTGTNLLFAQTLKGLDKQSKINIVSQANLSKTQSMGILATAGLTKEELAQVASTNAISASQVGATASTTGLSNAFKGLWAVMKAHPIISIAVGLTAVVGAVVGINKAIEKHNKELRESSTELTNAYKQEKSELQSLVDKYSELNEKLTSASLTTEEYESIKSELASIQDTLVTKYGEEANAIDVVNGKYDEQIAKLEQLEQKKANDYVTTNAGNISEDRKYVNDEIRIAYHQRNGNLSYSGYLQEAGVTGVKSYNEYGSEAGYFTLDYEGTREEIRKQIQTDINALRELYGDSNEAVNEVVSLLSKQLNSDELALETIEQSRANMLAYAKADIVDDENTKNAYEALIKSIEDYNTALENGEGIDEAKENLEELKSSFISATEGITDANLVYDELLSKINRPLDIKNQMGDLGNNQTYKNALDRLSEIESDTLKSFNYQEAVDSVSGLTLDSSLEAFGQLIKLLNISEDEVQTLINLLIELGYVQDSAIIQNEQNFKNKLGFNQNANNATDAKRNQEIIKFWDSLEDEDKTLFLNAEIPDEVLNGNIEDWETHLKELQEIADENTIVTHVELQTSATSMKSAFDDLYKAYDDYQQNGLSGIDTTNLSNLNKEDTFGNIDGTTASYEKFLAVMQDINSTSEEVQDAFDELASAYIYHSELAEQITEDNIEWVTSELEKNGVINASAVSEQMLINKLGVESAAVSECVRANLSLNGVKLDSKNASELLKDANIDEINTLIDEAKAANISANALINYKLDKIAANNATITTDGDIANLLALCEGLEGAIDLIDKYNSIKKNIESMKSSGAPSSAIISAQNTANSVIASIKAKIKGGAKANTSLGGGYYSGSSSGGGSGDNKETEKTYDWVEIKVQRLEEEISRLDKTVGNTYTNWANRNSALSSEISKVTEEIAVQQQVYDRYMQEANKVGLSADYISKIQNGELNIETITDEGLIEKINQYTEWHNKALECSDAIQDLNIKLGELAEKKFDNIQKEFESYISVINSYADVIDERINRTEEQGYFVSKKYYQELIKYENQELSKLKTEQSDLSNSLATSVASGVIEKGSEAWNDMQSEILNVQKSIEESTTALIEYNNAIRDLDWEIFDYILDRIDKINNEADFFISALENMKLYDDTGNFSDFGLTTASLNLVKMTTYIKMAKEYADELAKIESDLAKDPNSKTLLERREELIELQREAILNSENEKQAIKSLVQEGISIHLEALTDLIDKYKETLQSAKDLYDYQNNITEQTSEIARLQKILLAYQNDDSESARKSKQEYENKLKDAEKQLKETEWDKYISETEKLLDTLYTNYEETLNTRLDNIDALITYVSDSVNEGFSVVKDTIFSTSENLGYDMTDSMKDIYNVNSDGFLNLSSGLDNNTNNIVTNIINSSNSIISAINSIKDAINKANNESDKNANISTPTIPEVKPTTNNTTSSNATNNTNINNSSNNTTNASNTASNKNTNGSGDGVANKGDKVKFDNGKYYSDSYGNGAYGSWYLGEDVYITAINSKGSHPYHISTGKTIGNGDLGWVKLSQLKNYKVGSRNIPYKQYAWTQDGGSEILYRAKDNAMLTDLNPGDKVFTKEMSDRLWEIASGNIPIVNIPNIRIPNTSSALNSSQDIDFNISIGEIVSNNPEEFAKQLRSTLAKDNNTQKMIEEMTLGRAIGKNKLNVNKYL